MSPNVIDCDTDAGRSMMEVKRLACDAVAAALLRLEVVSECPSDASMPMDEQLRKLAETLPDELKRRLNQAGIVLRGGPSGMTFNN